MRGYPSFNFPEFHRITALLRSEGFEVISPAEMDEEHGIAEAAQSSATGDESVLPQTNGQILARDVKVVLDDVDGIIFMKGWEKSRGAQLEMFCGLMRHRQDKNEFSLRLWREGALGFELVPLDAFEAWEKLTKHIAPYLVGKVT